ncbi:MAG TPA: tetratricopeptide repeat protein [Gemmataceae bacterium]|nr:tetratricopeptide repeat protein [Gemmataceae bacterium]
MAFAIFSDRTLAADDDDAIHKRILKLNSVTGNEAMQAQFKELVKDSAGTKKMLKVADEWAKEKKDKIHYNAAYILGLAALQLKDLDIAADLFQVCSDEATKLKSANKLEQSFNGQLSVLLQQKKYDEAEKLCLKMLEIDGDERVKQFQILDVQKRLILITAKQGKIDEALKMTDKILSNDNEILNWYFGEVKGGVLQEAGRYKEAAEAFTDVLTKLEKSELLKPEEKESEIDRMRYLLSGVYIEMNDVDKCAEQLQALLKKHPDNATYNNDLGFVWADHNKNLDEAEKMIRKAIEEDRKQRKENAADFTPDEDKDNAAYIDSLGWVLFKKKQYAEAKKYLLEATKEKDGQHVEILDHLADVHMALGEKDQAIATWKKALDTDPDTKRDHKRMEEIRKKLKAAQGK